MLAWLTLVAAGIAAVGSIIGPVIAYRASIRTIEARSAVAAADRRQAQVDRAVDLAVGDNEKGAEVGIKMLDYLADEGGLTQDQASEVYSALDATVERRAPRDADLDALSDNEVKEVDS